MRTSFQLYSARDNGPLVGTLAALRELGYTRVEGYGGLLEDAAGLERALKEHGLEMPSCHMGLELLESDIERAISIARACAIDTVFAPHLKPEDRPVDAEGWKAFATQLEVLGKRLGDAHITFGWHNHDFELVKTANGALPLNILLEHAPRIAWQADLAWVARAGVNPMDMVERHIARIESVHVKDLAPTGECEDEDGWADPGQGIMDWDALIARLQRECSEILYVAEHDKPSDTLRFAHQAQTFFATQTSSADEVRS